MRSPYLLVCVTTESHQKPNIWWLCRLKDTCGSLSSVLLYLAFFLPTTINTAWVSVAAGVGILILPEQYNWDERTVEGLAVVLIVLVTALGEPLIALLPAVLTGCHCPTTVVAPLCLL